MYIPMSTENQKEVVTNTAINDSYTRERWIDYIYTYNSIHAATNAPARSQRPMLPSQKKEKICTSAVC